jgi:FtsP/CotA-like multicopper oxidase with cupredoxin domain
MNRWLAGPLILAIVAVGLAIPAAPQVRPFEPPPTLVPVGPQATNKIRTLMLGAELTPPGGCEQSTVDVNGRIVKVTLKEMYADSSIFNPATGHNDPLHLRSYGGCKEGPLIAVSPGDTLRLDLINDLPADDPTCNANPPAGLGLPPGVGCFNTINLHTHGLHVSPSGNSDNVLLNIAPQTHFPYEYNIPEDHPAGTFWYHAHRHGSTAVQVSSGSAGILVVRGNREYTAPTETNPHPMADIDTILHDEKGKPFAEQFFFFQQLAYACFSNLPNQDGGPWQQIFTSYRDPRDPDNLFAGLFNAGNNGSNAQGVPFPQSISPWICPAPTKDNHATPGVLENFNLQLFSASIWDTNGRFTSVNGVVQPTITVAAGEIQRWRFIHAGIHDTINLQIVHAIRQGGTDNQLATSTLSGNRQEQAAQIQHQCPTKPETLVPQFAIASDGLTMTRIHTLAGTSMSGSDGANYLQPGYRSDVLVVFPEDGYYCLLDQSAPSSQRFNPSNGNGGGSGPTIPQLLAIIHVEGGQAVTGDLRKYVEDALYAVNAKLPAPVRNRLRSGDLTPWAPFVDLPSPTHHGQPQQAFFTIGAAGFTINGKSYDPNVVNVQRQVNTTDDWVLSAAGEPHIFHIHVNPFEVMDVLYVLPNGTQASIFDADGHCRKDLPPDTQGLGNQYCSMWHTFRDTIFVENGYFVNIRTTYDRYIGEFVIHCHILDHEDAGMMMNIEIVPDISAIGGGIGMPGMKHTK